MPVAEASVRMRAVQEARDAVLARAMAPRVGRAVDALPTIERLEPGARTRTRYQLVPSPGRPGYQVPRFTSGRSQTMVTALQLSRV
jgi:hypothetical protein